MIELWGNADSVNVQKVAWCCEELALPYRRIDAGRHFGVVDTPEFRALNPHGLVPTIRDGPVVVWESNAIVRYLCAKFAPGTLWPTDVAQRAVADGWMDWSNGNLWPSLVPLFRAFHRMPAERRDPDFVASQTAEAARELAVLDAHLGQQPYVAGGRLTMADFVLAPPVWRWYALPLERAALHALRAWFDRLSARPAFRQVVLQPLA